jgi:hypothetical protein
MVRACVRACVYESEAKPLVLVGYAIIEAPIDFIACIQVIRYMYNLEQFLCNISKNAPILSPNVDSILIKAGSNTGVSEGKYLIRSQYIIKLVL